MRPILLIMWTAFQSFILRDNNNNNNNNNNNKFYLTKEHLQQSVLQGVPIIAII